MDEVATKIIDILKKHMKEPRDDIGLNTALTDLKIEPCIPGRANRKAPIVYDADLYKQRNRIERMFGRLKDWRRIATRYDRCAHAFMSAICIAATVIFWL